MELEEMRNPIQPFGDDGKGVTRFKGNKIVQYLLDNGGIDLNQLSRVSQTGEFFSRDDWEQFHQLIGYSVSSIPSLSEETARAVAQGGDSRDARIKALESMLEDARKHVRNLTTSLFNVHPDDLQP